MKKCEQKKDDDKIAELFPQVRNILRNSEFLSEMYLKNGLLARLLPYYRDFVSGRNVYPVIKKKNVCLCPHKKRERARKYIIANIIILLLFLRSHILLLRSLLLY